jgi:lipopolysaccharide export system protein LptC
VLEEILADLPVSNGDQAVLNAVSGTYNRTAQTMMFDKPFTVTSENGFSAELQSANIDLASGGLSSDAPVSISSGEASVVAQSMQMTDKGPRHHLSGQGPHDDQPIGHQADGWSDELTWQERLCIS